MRERGLRVRQRRHVVRTTDSRHASPVAPNRLNRQYQVERISALDRAWAGDITYIPTAQGWLYLAVVLDLKSRRVIGWSMDETMQQSLVCNALQMAISHRLTSGRGQEGLLFHSDRGSQYAAHLFQSKLLNAGITGSMSGKGDCWDNAPVESFFATLKKELVHQVKYATREQAKASLFEYIEVYYNRMRRHSALGYLSPVQYEQKSLN
jgi:transposase InsO family protein